MVSSQGVATKKGDRVCSLAQNHNLQPTTHTGSRIRSAQSFTFFQKRYPYTGTPDIMTQGEVQAIRGQAGVCTSPVEKHSYAWQNAL